MPRARDRGTVLPEDWVPLCGHHHRAYDAGDFDLYPHLCPGELVLACARAGGTGQALRHVMGTAWRQAPSPTLDARLERLEELCLTSPGEST
jgi:hypothetical protein